MEYEVPLPATGKTPPNYSYRHCNGHAVLHSRWLSGAKTSRCSPKAGKDGNSSRGGRRHSASSAPAGVTLFLSSVSIIVALQPINSGSRRSLGAARAWRGTRWALCLVLLLHAARWWWRKQEHADGMWTAAPSQHCHRARLTLESTGREVPGSRQSEGTGSDVSCPSARLPPLCLHLHGPMPRRSAVCIPALLPCKISNINCILRTTQNSQCFIFRYMHI
jgi:hypothetical protein